MVPNERAFEPRHRSRIHPDLTFLFVSEDEVDPLVDLARDELRLERLPVDAHELVGRRRPRRQLHVGHHARGGGGGAVLQATQLQRGD